MILLDGLPTKLFISEKPNNPNKPPVPLYAMGIVHELERQREEDLKYIEELKSELRGKELKEERIKSLEDEVEDYLFQLEEKKETIESQKAAIKHYQDIAKTQEDKIEELQSRVIRWKNKSDELRKANFKLRLYSPGSNAEYIAEALDNERKERERLQTILSKIKELLGKLNYDIT